MPEAILRPLPRKAPGRKRAPIAVKRPFARVSREEMIERRDRCLSAIAGQHNELNPNAFFMKARTLLTRHWYPSSWRSRADILRNAEWLVRVGARTIALNRRAPTGVDDTRYESAHLVESRSAA